MLAEHEPLLRQARAGDDHAQGRLLEAHRAHLSFLAQVQIGRRLQGKVDPADLVQEVFLRACRDFREFRGNTDQEFLAWLRQILAFLLANLVRHYQGTQRRDVRLERQLAVELEESSVLLDRGLMAPGSSPSQHAIRQEQAVLLAEALSRLPDSDRELLVLHHLQGLTFPEAAQRLGRSVDSVKKLWPRALARLRRALGGKMP